MHWELAVTLSVHNLDIYIDSDYHWEPTYPDCVQLFCKTLRSLIISLLTDAFICGNATLAGMASTELGRLQSVINATARLVCSARKSSLHTAGWLCTGASVDWAQACRVRLYCCRVADINLRWCLQSVSTSELDIPPMCCIIIDGLPLVHHGPSTEWCATATWHHCCLSFGSDSNRRRLDCDVWQPRDRAFILFPVSAVKVFKLYGTVLVFVCKSYCYSEDMQWV